MTQSTKFPAMPSSLGPLQRRCLAKKLGGLRKEWERGDYFDTLAAYTVALTARKWVQNSSRSKLPQPRLKAAFEQAREELSEQADFKQTAARQDTIMDFNLEALMGEQRGGGKNRKAFFKQLLRACVPAGAMREEVTERIGAHLHGRQEINY